MAMETMISDLMRTDNIDANKILSELLNPENINMKTDIRDPITFAILESVVEELEYMLTGIDQNKIKLPITKRNLKRIIKRLKEYLVSWNRAGRIEITETLKATKEEGTGAKSLFQRIAGLG